MSRKILYITPVLVPDSSAASKRILGNAKLFQSLGYDVSIYSGIEKSHTVEVDGILRHIADIRIVSDECVPGNEVNCFSDNR